MWGDVGRYAGVSGPYCLQACMAELDANGIDPRIISAMAEGDVAGCSPLQLVRAATAAGQSPPPDRWPRMALYHGRADRTAPCHHSRALDEALWRGWCVPEGCEQRLFTHAAVSRRCARLVLARCG